MWPWYLLGLTLVAAVAARENLPAITEGLKLADPAGTDKPKTVAKAKPAAEPQRPPPPTPDRRPAEQTAPAIRTAAAAPPFFYCGIRQDNCIVDGGTFVYQGDRIRIADIYVPATKEAKCDRERNLGGDAKEALRVLLNAGAFELAAWKPIDEDQYGRKLRIVVRSGKSIGDILVAKGLARPWNGQRESWCP